ncbi:MAG: response regulator transcription factor [Chloroflexota bacterium]
MQSKVLCVEGKYAGAPSFAVSLREKGYDVAVATTGKGALAALNENTHHVVVVNAPSMRTTGTRICQTLRSASEELPIILLSQKDQTLPIGAACADIILPLPFTVRKLDNRIKPFLPLSNKNLLVAGNISLDLDRLQVVCEGKNTHLTPRLCSLLVLLIKNAGKVVERDELFRKVWETDFTGDTRTLDVHISWLRQAIEKDPRKPEYLKTLRGVGYRLDV